VQYIPGDGRLTDLDTELEQLAVEPGALWFRPVLGLNQVPGTWAELQSAGGLGALLMAACQVLKREQISSRVPRDSGPPSRAAGARHMLQAAERSAS